MLKLKDLFGKISGIIHVFIRHNDTWIEVTNDIDKYCDYEIKKFYARDSNIFDIYLEGELNEIR